MKKIPIILFAVFSLSSAACAQSGPRFAGGNLPPVSQDSTSALRKLAASGGIVQNANLCPPDVPEAVWGADSALLGYRCITPRR
jgi:hypothetical protein